MRTSSSLGSPLMATTTGNASSIRKPLEAEAQKLLQAEAQKLLESDAMIVPVTVLKSRSVDNENYADKDATETTCALLKTILSKTQLKSM